MTNSEETVFCFVDRAEVPGSLSQHLTDNSPSCSTIKASGLTRRVLDQLWQCVDQCSHRSHEDLVLDAEKHLQLVHDAHQREPFVNYRLASAIVDTMRAAVIASSAQE